jgi:hypothetical protein
VHEKSPTETAVDLWQALLEGLVIPKNENYKFFQDDTDDTSEFSSYEQLTLTYKFLHDRVQQAAYFLIPEAEKKSTHLKIGQLLLKNTSALVREENIFEIVNQLNIGKELITNPIERNELAQLNLIAARKAKAATAYNATIKYLLTGINLLPVNSWQNDYDLTLSLYVEATETAYLSTDFDKMEELANIVLQNAKNVLDTVKVYVVKIQACIAQNKLSLGVQTALKILKLLGVNLPENPNQTDITQGLKATKSALQGQDIADLINLPKMTNPQSQAALLILSSMFSAVRSASPLMFPLIMFEQVQLSIKYGNSPFSCPAYANYGAILINLTNDIDSGYKFGQLALNLLAKFQAKEVKTLSFSVINSFIIHWKQHLRTTLPSLLEGYQNGLEIGDLTWPAWCAFVYCFYSYFASKELVSLEREMSNYIQAIAQFKQQTPLYYSQTYHQTVLNLIGGSRNLTKLQGDVYDEDVMLPIHQQAKDRPAIYHLHLNKTILCYLFEEYEQAIKNADIAAEYLDGVPGTYITVILRFYDSLARLAVYNYAEVTERENILNKVQINQEKIKLWAEYAPMNHLHKFYLVEAEKYRVLDEYLAAIDYYERAIATAKENQYLNEEALANELAAKFYLRWGKNKIAQVYLIDAYYNYVRWGSSAKVYHLEKTYPELLASIIEGEKIRNNYNAANSLQNSNFLSVNNSRQIPSSSSFNLIESLELTTVMKASQTLAGEIQLDKLLTKLMQIVMENAGAEKCILSLLQDDNLVIEAVATLAKVNVLQSIPVRELHKKNDPLTKVIL